MQLHQVSKSSLRKMFINVPLPIRQHRPHLKGTELFCKVKLENLRLDREDVANQALGKGQQQPYSIIFNNCQFTLKYLMKLTKVSSFMMLKFLNFRIIGAM